MRFLNSICELQLSGLDGARLPGRRVKTIFHTSHPGLCAALRRDPRWRQVSAKLHGVNKRNSAGTMTGGVRSMRTRGTATATATATGAALINAGYGGHFRAVQGFRYQGEAASK